MVKPVFLGWDGPFLGLAVGWLLERREALAGMWVVVPTAQSGRRLREALALAAGTGGVLGPRVVTPGAFLQSVDGEAAGEWVERLAWVEVLEAVADWGEYAAIFPEAPVAGGGWADGLAGEMLGLRRALQENGVLMAGAGRRLAQTPEGERWEALGRLEGLVEGKLQEWGVRSRSRLLADGLRVPGEVSRVVVAGVAEMPPLVERALVTWGGRVEVLIGAPVEEEAWFSGMGRPVVGWTERVLAWPGGSVEVVADARQQAMAALRVVGDVGTSAEELVLGTADAEVGAELGRAFTRVGWTAFHPAGAEVNHGMVRWLRCWEGWLTEPSCAVMAELLTLPETGVLVGGRRAQKARALAVLLDRWMVVRVEDLLRRVETEIFRNEQDRLAARELATAAGELAGWREGLLGKNFRGALERLLRAVGRTDEGTRVATEGMVAWLAGAAPLMERVGRGAVFWMGLMRAEVPGVGPLPPEGRVVDVQGWLELFHEPGGHLVLCGMNEGRVPGRSGGEPWLGEPSRVLLGLTREVERAARDAYLFHAMVEARRNGGRVDVICGKSGAGGEALLPSRLLLAAGREALPERVKLLFQEVEPPEAGMQWQADWRWQPRRVEVPQRLNVTSLGDYLACPFRYYLKHAVQMRGTEVGRAEWNARDFGTVAHEVLERWGRDVEARNFCEAERIHRWLGAELERVVVEWFGKRVPLAVRIQVEALRQRLAWLARVQAATQAEGWEVMEVESKMELVVGGATVVAMIDRIDRHRESGRLRVLDYKTGKVEGVAQAHRRKLQPASELPRHLTRECPAVYGGGEGGKSVDFLWQNLQLPLYAAAVVERGEALPVPCYFTLRATEAEVAIHEWADFEAADLDAAKACADWVVGQISAGVFGPPAEKVAYDDYAILAAGQNFEELFHPMATTGLPGANALI